MTQEQTYAVEQRHYAAASEHYGRDCHNELRFSPSQISDEDSVVQAFARFEAEHCAPRIAELEAERDQFEEAWSSERARALAAEKRLAEAEEVIRQLGDQFGFYVTEHRAAGKFEKAATNERFRDLAFDFLASLDKDTK